MALVGNSKTVYKIANMNRDTLLELFAQNESFSSLDTEQLGALIDAGEIKELAAETDLIVQNEASSSIWGLIEGAWDVFVDGDPVNHISEIGQVVGEISAVSMTPATATVRTKAQSTALCISHQALHTAMRENPKLGEAMVRSMTKYLGRK